MVFPRLWIASLYASVAILFAGTIRGETAHFLLGGGTSATGPLSQSFVVSTSDAAQILQARAVIAGLGSRYAGSNYRARIRIAAAAGGDAVNRNYYAPGRPAWNWRAAELLWFVFVDYVADPSDGPPGGPTAPPDLPAAAYTASPAEISADPTAWIGAYGDVAEPWGFQLVAEVTPSGAAAPLVNLSTRGRTGPGDDRMISGVVIGAGAPRLAVIRALGPSLSSAGVANLVADPRIEIYLGGTKVFENDSWQSSGRAADLTTLGLAPGDAREPALLVPLYPGAYTVHVIGAAEGNCLLEIYAVDP